MRRFAGACRFVFNRALALQNENHEAGNKYIPYAKMASWLIEWKSHPDTQWLKDAPSQPLQQSLKDLERGYKNFFQKRAAFPRFKKRGQNDAFRYTANADVNGARNILAAGHAVLACGGMVQSDRPLKQEPTEMNQATA